MTSVSHPLEPPIPQAEIGEHGIVGNLQTAALIDRRGGVDWLCWPEFDSDPIFNHLLDARGGRWDVSPAVPFQVERAYIPDSNVLRTDFITEKGRATVTDLMVLPRLAGSTHLVRTVICSTGSVPMSIRFAPTDGFSTTPAHVNLVPGGVEVYTSNHTLHLSTNVPWDVVSGEARHFHEIEQGREIVMILSPYPIEDVEERASQAIKDTRTWWSDWLGEIALPSFATDLVRRSALTLKLLAYDGGGLVAAPTTSLPEEIGGVRNWDYRYTWLRDSSEAVLSLEQLSHLEEASSLWNWLSRAGEHGGGRLAVTYTVRGETVPKEREIETLSGHRSSRPVRVGNQARSQSQLDVFGHILKAVTHGYMNLDMKLDGPREMLVKMVNDAATRWQEPDESIWEIQGGPRQYTYSKLMCWLALDCALDLHADGAIDGDADFWESERLRLRETILNRGWSDEEGAFVMTLDGHDLDASALSIPVVGLLPPYDERCRSTRERIVEKLTHSGLVYRHRIDDNLAGDEGAFLLCSFWLADSFTLDGDPDRGAEIFEAATATANDLLLLSEQVDITTGEPLGNFPQGLSHLGLIASALRLAQFDS